MQPPADVTLDFGGHYILMAEHRESKPRLRSAQRRLCPSEQGALNLPHQEDTIAYSYARDQSRWQLSATTLAELIAYQRVDVSMLVSYYLIYRSHRRRLRAMPWPAALASNCQVSFTGNNTSLGNCYALYSFGGSGNQFLTNTVTNSVSATATA